MYPIAYETEEILNENQSISSMSYTEKKMSKLDEKRNKENAMKYVVWLNNFYMQTRSGISNFIIIVLKMCHEYL